uniref:Choline/carnitine acyltransferase domain-containing protein n=1 Tax=Strigamia maritima TaxID=126957 RepID=T1IJQ1_STRMM
MFNSGCQFPNDVLPVYAHRESFLGSQVLYLTLSNRPVSQSRLFFLFNSNWMLFKVLFPSGRVLHTVKGKFRNDIKATWHLRDSAIVLSTVAQPLAAPLPRLPVPTLQQTFQKYLKTIKPVISENEYAQTEKLVRDFTGTGSLGEKLQFLLEERAKNTENWLSDWWLNVAYMEFRSPLVAFSSPGLVFPQENFNSTDDQIRYAAKLVAGALDFKYMIDNKQIPLEMMGGKPLDMSQYHKILSTCRIPGDKRDTLRHFGLEIHPPSHIVVIHKNQFFKLEVYAQNNEVLSEKQIESFLRDIVKQSEHRIQPIGILTSDSRDIWANVYNKLMKDKANQKSLYEIQKSIFVLCIDNKNNVPKTTDKRTLSAMQLIHGCGSRNNAGNRWFDKTVQFIVGREGTVGLTYEHSPAEGPPIASLMDHVVKYVSSSSTKHLPAKNPLPPQRLTFNITDEIQEDIYDSIENMDDLVHALQVTAYTFKGYGKNFIKSQKLSPDSYIQMAIQLAFFRLHKVPGACYESASTRQYLHGRTENIRSTSVESVAFCKAMLESKSNLEKVQHIRSAIENHKRYVSDAIGGFGVDRHLLGLKLIALENGIDVPSVFLDSGYRQSSNFRLSTSQVSGKCDSFMIYGPLTTDGYGCCYNPLEKQINFGLTSLVTCSETCSDKFSEALEKSLTDMQNVLVMTQSSKL